MWKARADLHSHSTCSDGSLTPEELVAEADITGLAWFALTDHDTIDGIARAQAEIQRRALPLELIPGAELSAYSPRNNIEFHILAYGFSPDNEKLQRYMTDFQNERVWRLDRILALLAEQGVPLTREQVYAFSSGKSVGRVHIAQALTRCGYVDSPSEAFQKYLADGAPAYVPRKKYTPEEIIQLIHSWSAIAVLAHPNYFNNKGLSEQEIEEEFGRCIAMGLDGIECWHSKVDESLQRVIKRLALRYGLVLTGGSDTHGNYDNRPRLGECRMTESAMKVFLAALSSRKA